MDDPCWHDSPVASRFRPPLMAWPGRCGCRRTARVPPGSVRTRGPRIESTATWVRGRRGRPRRATRDPAGRDGRCCMSAASGTGAWRSLPGRYSATRAVWSSGGRRPGLTRKQATLPTRRKAATRKETSMPRQGRCSRPGRGRVPGRLPGAGIRRHGRGDDRPERYRHGIEADPDGDGVTGLRGVLRAVDENIRGLFHLRQDRCHRRAVQIAERRIEGTRVLLQGCDDLVDADDARDDSPGDLRGVSCNSGFAGLRGSGPPRPRLSDADEPGGPSHRDPPRPDS